MEFQEQNLYVSSTEKSIIRMAKEIPIILGIQIERAEEFPEANVRHL